MAEGADGKTDDNDKAASATASLTNATSDPKDDTKSSSGGDPAWPPPEAAPKDEASAAETPGAAELPSSAPPPGDPTQARPAPSEDAPKAVSVAVVAPTEAEAQGGAGAALPGQEMGFSESTLHWLAGGETTGTTRVTRDTGTLPSYDPRAPVAGRKRAVLVVGGAGLLALIVAGTLFVQARSHRAPGTTAATAEPARDLTARAEAAYAANRISEAIELAHLALSADPRYADAHLVMANCERARNQISAAREQYRKYLDLAPLGLHAAEAREALGSLPQ